MDINVSDLQGLPLILRMEIEENILRKDFTESELGKIQERLIEHFSQRAFKHQGQRHGTPEEGTSSLTCTRNFVQEPMPHRRENTTQKVAKLFGESEPTVRKRLEVLHKAHEAPEKYAPLVARMDATGKVEGAYRELKKREKVAALRTREQEPTSFTGVYDVIVIDPPWPVAVQGREERPQQLGLPYTAMTVEDIQALTLPLANDCHVWLWTTQRFLPAAFRCLDAWQLKYVCCFVWMKPGGMQPMYLPQFNCEFALYARQGNPPFVTTTDFATCFTAPRTEHSEKPQVFYDMVQRVTAGRRLDMFARRQIAGFEVWGYEAPERSA